MPTSTECRHRPLPGGNLKSGMRGRYRQVRSNFDGAQNSPGIGQIGKQRQAQSNPTELSDRSDMHAAAHLAASPQ